MKRTFKIIGATFCLSLGLFLSSCVSNEDSPGLEYMPDMYRSPAIEAYVDHGEVRGSINDEMKSRLTAMTPPNGTVPYVGKDSSLISIMLPYWRKPGISANESHGLFDWIRSANVDGEYDYKEAIKDVNPLKLSATNVEGMFKSGKEIFNSKCAHCHGEKGDGQGPMVTSGAYAGVPAYSTLTALGDGQMFYSIYYGKNMMGAHASLVNKKEIWTLVHYIRKFQDDKYGTFDASGNPVSKVVADTTKVSVAVK